jgi:hypothetical protein
MEFKITKEKHYVFSARTTEAGLKPLYEVKAKVNMGWDELVIEAVSEHFKLDKSMMTLPKKEIPAKEPEKKKPPAKKKGNKKKDTENNTQKVEAQNK